MSLIVMHSSVIDGGGGGFLTVNTQQEEEIYNGEIGTIFTPIKVIVDCWPPKLHFYAING